MAYLRRSTGKQALSPAAQRELISAWAEREGVEIVEWCLEDPKSGSLPPEKRPELRHALAAVPSLRAAVLVVAKRDRIARDALLTGLIARELRSLGARLVSAAGEGNGDAPADVLMSQVIDSFAEFERRLISARTAAALAVKRSRGERLGGTLPYGHRLADDGVHLVEDEAEQELLRRIRALHATGLSSRRIAAQLDAEGVPSRGSRWHHVTVAKLVRSSATL